MQEEIVEGYSTVKKVANKRIETLKDTLVYSVDNVEQLHYIRGQIKSLEDLLQDLKDLQLKQERLNDGELRGFERST
jgi:macrodomain Ter protein organizer (MatP/YcbG family)